MDRLHHAHVLRHTRREEAIDLRVVARTTVTAMQEASRAMLVPRSSCTNDSAPGCTKPTTTPTLFIVLAVCLPVVGAAILLFYLHRRNVKRLAAEDKMDKYKSLDFGVEQPGKKRGPEMKLNGLDVEKSHGRGLSMEPDLSSPYLLPAALHDSRESFNTLNRQKDSYDPYGPVSFGDDASIRTGNNPSRGPSVYTQKSNDKRMSRTSPAEHSIPEIRFPEPAASPENPFEARHERDPFSDAAADSVKDSPIEKPTNATGPPPPVDPPVQQNNARSTTTPSPPPRVQSQSANVILDSHTSILSTSSYGGAFELTPASPRQSQTEAPAPLAPQPRRPVSIVQNGGLGVDDSERTNNRLSMSLRPLPPTNDDPNEDPEARANRIRSFYKEYFDDSKPEPAEHAAHQIYDDYHEDYASEYLDGSVFDPHTGNFIVAQPSAPFAEPITRRAMTPPPRAPPRFRSNTNQSGGPHMSQSSFGSPRMPPPRGMSSMSGRLPAPKKPMAPPSPLASLPTPGKLDNDFGIFNAADFAPPVSFRERQNGMRPDSPLGAPRPYSPAVRPHTPLASTFEDLAPLPTPAMLRKSGTFTALDFAPPPKIRDPFGGSNASDSGSIRSNRSGMSGQARMAVRNGAYRVSRIPKEMVGTQDDMVLSLRPTLDMVNRA